MFVRFWLDHVEQPSLSLTAFVPVVFFTLFWCWGRMRGCFFLFCYFFVFVGALRHHCTGDIREYDKVEAFVKNVLKKFNRIDVLVNNGTRFYVQVVCLPIPRALTSSFCVTQLEDNS